MTEITVIGSGFAGLSAAISGRLLGADVTILTAAQPSCAAVLENFPGLPGIAGGELMGRLRAHALALGIPIHRASVRCIEQADSCFLMHTDNGMRRAHTVILATGVSHPNNACAVLPPPEMYGSRYAADRRMATSLPGLFAAGSCIDAPSLAAVAIGTGQIAACSAAAHLQSIKTAPLRPVCV